MLWASQRFSLLKILAGPKCGYSRSTLNTSYTAYSIPILTYCYEPLITSKPMIKNIETFHNLTLLLITGAIDTTNIDWMHLCTNYRPISEIIQEIAVLLWKKKLSRARDACLFGIRCLLDLNGTWRYKEVL